MSAPHSFPRRIAAGSKRDALVVKSVGMVDGLLDFGGFVGDRGRQRSLIRFQVVHRALQGRNRARILCECLLLRLGIGFGLLGGGANDTGVGLAAPPLLFRRGQLQGPLPRVKLVDIRNNDIANRLLRAADAAQVGDVGGKIR